MSQGLASTADFDAGRRRQRRQRRRRFRSRCQTNTVVENKVSQLPKWVAAEDKTKPLKYLV